MLPDLSLLHRLYYVEDNITSDEQIFQNKLIIDFISVDWFLKLSVIDFNGIFQQNSTC